MSIFFADEIVIITVRSEFLQTMVDTLSNWCNK